jgi:hypothetical protein
LPKLRSKRKGHWTQQLKPLKSKIENTKKP